MKRLLRWVGYVLGGIVAIVLLIIAGVYAVTGQRINKTYPTKVEAEAVPADSVSLERGHHLVLAVGRCVSCHGDNLAGKTIGDDLLFGRLASSNLTKGKGGVGSTYTNADWVRSIRYGVRSDGKPLIFMPSFVFYYFSDADLGAIIAYLNSIPPADSEKAKTRIGPIGRALSLFTDFPLIPAERVPRNTTRLTAVPTGVTKEYGEYLINTGGCSACHTSSLSGGVKIAGVVSANLTPTGIGKWSEADFMKVIRTGVRPDGRILSAVMPWPEMKTLTGDELKAIWMYLQTVPARQRGG